MESAYCAYENTDSEFLTTLVQRIKLDKPFARNLKGSGENKSAHNMNFKKITYAGDNKNLTEGHTIETGITKNINGITCSQFRCRLLIKLSN